jgi:hydroxyacylglutathione hydrolase
MLLRRIEAEGLAHVSWLVGDRREAFVVDPRRDCDVYVDEAARAGCRIVLIFETHRQEDFVLGSVELAARTGAEIWHAEPQLPYGYGRPVRDGQTWSVGRLRLEALSTPGHTPGGMSYLLYEQGGAPWILFSGDTLFAGDLGRVDLPGVERREEMAGLLYDSLFGKILTLDDGVLVCPSHGPGSVCGESIAPRPWTTIGLEKSTNPKLKLRDRGEFVARIARVLPRPPYFRKMEDWNLRGAPLLGTLPSPPPLAPDAFRERTAGIDVIDTRPILSFGAAHVPGALSLWMDGLPSFAGWFLSPDKPMLLVTEEEDPREAVRRLVRLGFDDVAGCLAGGMFEWNKAGLPSGSVRMASTPSLCRALDAGEGVAPLDVRKEEEREEEGRITGALEIPLTELPERLGEVPADRPVYVFCGTGLRSMTAASLMLRRGAADPVVVLGGLAGWSSTACPLA